MDRGERRGGRGEEGGERREGRGGRGEEGGDNTIQHVTMGYISTCDIA